MYYCPGQWTLSKLAQGGLKGGRFCGTLKESKKANHLNLSQLAAQGSKLDLALEAAKGNVKLVKLPTAKPRRAQLVYTSGVVKAGQGSGRSAKVG